jgi:hypothetical protein
LIKIYSVGIIIIIFLKNQKLKIWQMNHQQRIRPPPRLQLTKKQRKKPQPRVQKGETPQATEQQQREKPLPRARLQKEESRVKEVKQVPREVPKEPRAKKEGHQK